METSRIFCDWITVKQTHAPHKPLYGGITKYTDAETGETTQSYKFKTHQGLHDSSVQIRSDGETVEFSGNPSRFNRQNNVTGYDLDNCKIIINQIMESLGLPPFTEGTTIRLESGERKTTGAKFTRIDMTQNFQTGSPRTRDLYMEWIQTQEYGRLAKLLYNKNTYFGKESDSRTFRIYDKAREIIDKNGDLELARLLHQKGSIRYEWEYRKFLKTKGLNLWSKATQARLSKQFEKDIKPMVKEITPPTSEELDALPNGVLATYLMYQKGYDVKKKLSKPTFIKHKRILKELGIDISNRTVLRMEPPVQVIEIQESNENQLDLLEG